MNNSVPVVIETFSHVLHLYEDRVELYYIRPDCESYIRDLDEYEFRMVKSAYQQGLADG